MPISRFRGSIREDGFGLRRQVLSRNLPPLQLDKDPGDGLGYWDDILEEETVEGGCRENHLLTSRSERLIATRMNELSQLESPLLRELAYRLGVHLKIETPQCFVDKFQHPYADLHVLDRWEDYQGCKNWEGLIEPDFDIVLKGEILRYGEFAQATYDAFDNVSKDSENHGTCKYTKSKLLEEVGLESRGYEITNYLYATTNIDIYQHWLTRSSNPDAKDKSQRSNGKSEHGDEEKSEKGDEKSDDAIENNENHTKQCNWMGFVAVCTSAEEIERLGRRDILIAWRGSVTPFDWVADLMDYNSPSELGPSHTDLGVRVEKGFLHLYTSKNENSRYNRDKSARDQVRDAVIALIRKYRKHGKLSITVTGHSLGSALATLCAYDIAECEWNLESGNPSVLSDWHSLESGRQEGGHSGLLPHLGIFSNYDTSTHQYVSENVTSQKNPNGSKDGSTTQFLKPGRVPVTVYSFGGPRVGNQAFVDRMKELGVAVLRVVNKYDKVPKLPGLVVHSLEKKFQVVLSHGPWAYRHVGVRIKVCHTLSEYLDKGSLKKAHNLETYLHLVDAYQGTHAHPKGHKGYKHSIIEHLRHIGHTDTHSKLLEKYKPYERTFRDFALVNKRADFLKKKYKIPPCWWQEKNKGLVRDADGNWRLPQRDFSVPKTPEKLEEEERQEEEQLERDITIARQRSKLHYNDGSPPWRNKSY